MIAELVKQAEGTVDGFLDGVKISFFFYPYPLLEKSIEFCKNVKLATPVDIAVMKLVAVGGRNVRKDFIDLYTYFQQEGVTLAQLLKRLDDKFFGFKYDIYHIYKSLSYFEEADKEPMPKMLVDCNWKKIKEYFTKEMKKMKF